MREFSELGSDEPLQLSEIGQIPHHEDSNWSSYSCSRRVRIGSYLPFQFSFLGEDLKLIQVKLNGGIIQARIHFHSSYF